MRRGEQPRAQPGGAQAGRDHRRDAALTVGAADVDEELPALGMAAQRERVLHAARPEANAARLQRVELRQGSLIASGHLWAALLSQLLSRGGDDRSDVATRALAFAAKREEALRLTARAAGDIVDLSQRNAGAG